MKLMGITWANRSLNIWQEGTSPTPRWRQEIHRPTLIVQLHLKTSYKLNTVSHDISHCYNNPARQGDKQVRHKYELIPYLNKKLNLIDKDPTSYLCTSLFTQLSNVGLFKSHMTHQSPASYMMLTKITWANRSLNMGQDGTSPTPRWRQKIQRLAVSRVQL